MATKLATHIFLFAISVAMLSCNISAATFPTGLVDVGPYLAQIEQYLPEPFDEGNVVAEECTFNMSLGWVNCTYINTDVTVVPGFDALPPWQIGDNTYKIYMRFNDSAQNVRRADATFSTIKDEPGWISACVKIISSFTVCTAKEYDMLGPVFASCPSYFGIEAINSSGATVTYPTPAATDKIGVFGDVNCTPASGSIFAVGNTPTSCSAIDFFGFSGSCSFSISVVDTTAPSITILGNNPATVKEKSAYTDSGATATDLVDGPVTVTKTGSVNTNVIGTYTITYTAKDAHENTATATRTVNVVDGTAPVIAAHANVVAEATSAGGAIVSYTPPIASDAVDGDLPADCTPASGSQFAIGATTITCTKTDAAGNVATPKTFKVTVKDTTKPVIAAHNDELAEATSADGAIVSYTPPIASDAVDGDLPADCAPASGSQFALGATTITCTKTDSHGNAAKPVKFAVTVEHKAPPVIRPHDAVAIEATSSAGAIATYAAPIAVDAVDGELIASCSPVSGAQFAFGDTTVTCTKSDSAGNAAIPTSFKVTVSDTTKPVITLLGFNPETIQVKSIYADLGATAIDAVDGAISVTSSGLVNTNALGSNTITYSASDSHGNTATATRTVNVVDTTAPTITLVGENPVEIEVGSAYADAGAIAIDNYDGTITSSIVTVNPVNTSAVGTYSVTYDVSDSSGNHAAQVTRTVNVVDTTAPIITILGSNPATVEAKTAYADAGATALDAVDGMVPVVASGTVNTDVLGEYTITYTATDESGNTATATRTVNVVDTTAPSITILGSNPDFSEVNTEYADAGATAFDAVDGIAIVVATGSVNINAIGSNTITYTASDSHGNTATATRVVNVVDTTAPSITLVGETPIIIEVGLAYFDAGATAVDNYDGIITSRIVAVNSVNTSVVGTYTVTYDVEDSSDNHAAQVARTVNVIDTTAPVISLLGENPITIEVGSTYSDAGATATDNYDGDITASIATVNSVNTNAVGTYAITYDVSDSSGNPATQVTRTVNVVDTSAPIISILGSNPATVEAKAAYVDAGATALDAVDGAVIVTSSSTVNTDELGTYLVTYSATDLHGNTATATRTVTVVDTVAPVISIIGDNPASVEVYAVYADAGATAFDAVDGTVPVVASGTVNTNALGSNTITYSASDSHGNTATATRVVNVVDTTAPTITLIGEMSVTIEIGSTYVDAGASANDNYDGDITAGIVIVNSVNTNAVGSYSITYDVTDSSGNFATQVTRTVNVVDTSAPIISILGSNPATAEAKTAYADAGATALDAVDGVVIVTSSSTVNTDELGTYWVTYSATDSHGNTATATRTVNVVDTTKPEITILGNNPATLEAKTAYADAGAAAFDTVDGTIPVVASGTVNADILGEYTITYVATDSSGNTATATRIVNVVDTTAPIITVLGENPATIEFGLEYSDAGATALDNYDGTITSSIVTVNPVNTSAVGAYVVTYDVSDSSGNHALQSIRTVNVVDTVAPAIALVGSDSVTVEVNTAYTDAGATATDNAPGLVEVTFIDTSNIHVVGEYIISYTATDASGNTASISRTIHVVDTTAPVISLIGENPRSIVFGTEYIDDGATATDNYDEIVMVTTNNPVNPNVVGTYVVTYDATDAAGNSAAQRNRTVNVLPSPLEVELAKAKQDITTALVLNGNPSAGNLLADLYLPIALSSHPGVAIRWDSTNPEAISTSGNVTRPTESDANVNLTATLTLEEFTESVLLEFTVRKAQPAAVPDNGTVTVTTGQDEVVIDATNNDTALLVIVPGNIGSNTTIFVNFAALVNGTGESSEVALPTGINMTRTGPLAINYTAAIPANTTITGPAGWDGLMQVPQVVDSSAFFAPSGTANVVVQFGTGAELNFSQPVMVVLGGMAGKKAAWAHGTGALSDITTACNSATNPTNIGQTGPARECYIDLGADLVIWTYHFTSFSAYTPAQVNGGQKDTYNIYNSGSVYSPNRSSAQATPVPTAVPTQAASTPVVTAHPTATAVPTAQKQFPIAVASENQQEYAELPSSPIEEGPGVQTGLLTANPAGLGILVLLLIGVAAYMIFRKN